MGWNDLTKQQQADWKKKNFNMKVNVSEAQLNKLRREGTPTKAIAKYKNDPSMREALNRFYGRDRVAKAIGNTPKPPVKPKTKPKTTPKTNTPTKPTPTKPKSTSKTMPKRIGVRGPVGVDPSRIKTAQKGIAFGKTEAGKKSQEKAIENALLIASFLPFVGGAARVGRTVMMAKKAETTYANAKKILAAQKLVKKGKALPVAVGKNAGRRAAKSPKSITKRVIAGTKSPSKYVKNNGKRVASKTTRPVGKHAGPKVAGRKVIRTRTSGRRTK